MKFCLEAVCAQMSLTLWCWGVEGGRLPASALGAGVSSSHQYLPHKLPWSELPWLCSTITIPPLPVTFQNFVLMALLFFFFFTFFYSDLSGTLGGQRDKCKWLTGSPPCYQ